MGRQSSSKQQGPKPAAAQQQSGISPLLIAGGIVVVIGIGVLAFWPGRDTASTASSPAAATAAPATPGAPPMAVATEPTPEIVAATEATAKLGPHKQANLPPIPFRGYAPPRSPEVVTAAFHFAAEHPEVLSYVPCFCGCQQMGHKGNTDCFVRSRATNGDVIEWEEHGVECAVCIDVATRARQMYSSGASVRDIRSAVEKEFGSHYPSMTPTPHPAAAHTH